ncbi:hypothetical protein Mapa_007040 [Marchantia paleacea]|nr:hypothetical protein Mapa_007040 [Marchantia paleacea]
MKELEGRMDAVIPRSSADEERDSLYHEQSAVKKAKTYLIGGHGLAIQLHHYLHVVIADLVHQEADVRVKALRNLESIVTSGTYGEWDPQTDTMPLLRNLLEWFNLPTPSAADQVLALSILTTLAQACFILPS